MLLGYKLKYEKQAVNSALNIKKKKINCMKINILILSLSFLFNYSAKSQATIEVPKHVQASENLAFGINVTWEVVKGAESYAVYRAEKADKRLLRPIKTVQTDRLQDRDGLKQGVRYFYAVRAIRNGQKSSLSNLDDGRLLQIAASKDSLNLSLNECAPLSIEVVDSVISLKKGFLDVQYSIVNLCQCAIKEQVFRLYLSENDVFEETKDGLIGEINIPKLSDNSVSKEVIRLQLPETTKMGEQKLLVLRVHTESPMIQEKDYDVRSLIQKTIFIQ